MPSTACLVPAYAPMKGEAILPPTEPTLLLHCEVARHAHWPEPGPVECRKPALCGPLRTDFRGLPFCALG